MVISCPFFPASAHSAPRHVLRDVVGCVKQRIQTTLDGHDSIERGTLDFLTSSPLHLFMLATPPSSPLSPTEQSNHTLVNKYRDHLSLSLSLACLTFTHALTTLHPSIHSFYSRTLQGAKAGACKSAQSVHSF